MYAFGLLKLSAVGSEANCADSCTATGTSVAAAAAAITAANASRCLRLDGSNVIRHSREPGRHNATSSAIAAITATRSQSKENGTRTLA